MLFKKEGLSLKNYFFALVIACMAIFLDFNSPSTTHHDELRFLGTGSLTEAGPCNDLGYRTVVHSTTVLWIQVGDSYTTEEPC